MISEIFWETIWIVTARQRDSKSGPTSEREKWRFLMRGVQTNAGHYLMSQSSVHAQVRVFLLKKKNQIRISLIYRKMICLNLTLVIHLDFCFWYLKLFHWINLWLHNSWSQVKVRRLSELKKNIYIII